MRITFIVDNSPSIDRRELQTEHGLSLYIEYNSHRILCDMGTDRVFADNAKNMNIDLSACDFAFISHGHNDHCGGLEFFLENIKDKKIYMHKEISDNEYFSTRRGARKNLSINNELFSRHKGRFNYLDTTTEIANGIFAIQCRTTIYPMPYGNSFLWKNDGKKDEKDTFGHELSLAFVTPKGLVIVSPCSHCGALNIINECKVASGCGDLYAYIGGLHFIEGEKCISEASALAEAIIKKYPDTLFFTGHCTCDTAKGILEQKTDKIRMFYTGCTIDL